MSRLFGADGLVPASAIGAVPDSIYCARCSGVVDARGKVDIAKMQALCVYCAQDSGRLASLNELVVPTTLDTAA